MKQVLITTSLFFAMHFSFAQTIPTIEWQKSLGGSAGEYAYSIGQTSDGGYIVAGDAISNDGDVVNNHGGGGDYWIVKLIGLGTGTGTIDWQIALGGTGGDHASSIQQTTDGGYIVAGRSASIDGDVTGNHGYDDYWIVKLTANGAIDWQKSFGGTGDDQASFIQQTNDGGYIVSGNSKSNNGDVTGNHGLKDYWIVKLSVIGTIEWEKSLGGTGNDEATSVKQTADSGYIISGFSRSNDGDVTGHHGTVNFSDSWVVKLSNNGALEWQKSLGGTSGDQSDAVQQTTDGGYIVAGGSSSVDGDVTGNHGNTDFWIVKLNDTGTVVWQKSAGGTQAEYAYSIQQMTDGNYIVAGYTYSYDGDVTFNHGDHDNWVVNLSDTGAIQWQLSMGGGIAEYARSIQQTNNGGYIVTGISTSNDGDVTGNHGAGDFWAVKLLDCGLLSITNPTNQIININNDAQFIAESSDPWASFQWQSDTGAGFQDIINTGQFSGATNDTLTVSNTSILNNNQIFRCIIYSGSCSDTTAFATLTVADNIGIAELKLRDQFSIYPNPASTKVQFNFSGSDEFEIEIFNLLGEKIVSAHNKTEMEIMELDRGIYFVHLISADKTVIQKLIVQHK